MTLNVAQKIFPVPEMNIVHCGDVVEELRGFEHGDFFDVVIADPPYNIRKNFGNNFDDKTLSDYVRWSDEWLGECLRLVKPAAPVYVYGFAEVLAHIAVRYSPQQQRWLAWHYTNKTVPTSRFWQRSHESILCLWKGDRPAMNVDEIREDYTDSFIKNAAGKVRKETFCRYSTKGKKTIYNAHDKGALPRDVIKIPALAGGAGYSERYFFCKTCEKMCAPKALPQHRAHDIIKHPTQKPMALAKKLLSSAAAKDGHVLIPFAGSGSECIAAKQLDINFFAADINPDYVLLANSWLGLERILFNERRPIGKV